MAKVEPAPRKRKIPDETVRHLIAIGQGFYARGWTLGTSGNFSAVVNTEPLALAITSSGADKGSLSIEQILLIDENARVIEGGFKPSAETHLHIRIVREIGAGAVLHTHSVWSTTLSDVHATDGGLSIEGYEMLKGLVGIQTHEHKEWLPIIENSQDILALAETVSNTIRQHPTTHGFLLRRHGLYTWGRNLDEARRHVEILEFLLEVTGRKRLLIEGRN